MKNYSKMKPTARNNAVIYARYSSANQNEQSIDGQIRVITEFAERQGYIIDTYIDRAMTGRNDDRPDFQRMINDSVHCNFDYVLVYKLDRFSRKQAHPFLQTLLYLYFAYFSPYRAGKFA